MKWLLGIFRKICGYCPMHGYWNYPSRYRRNTAYVEDSANWGYTCEECQKDEHAYYQELWDDYYGSRL